MTTENLLEAWRSKVKNIFKEAEEFEPAVGNDDEVEAPAGDIGVPAADGNSPAPATGNVDSNALPVEDESQSKEPITLTKGLLVQLLDAAIQSAKSEELPALGNDAVGNAEGNAELSVEIPTEPLAADNAAPDKEKAPFGEGHKKKGDAFLAKFKKDGKDKKEEKKVEETKDEEKTDKDVVKEDDANGVLPNAPVVPPVEGNAEGNALGNALGNDLGNAEGNDLDDVGGTFDVSSVVDKAFELFAAKQDGTPLDVDVLEQLKGAATGLPVEGGAEGNADFAAAGNAEGNALGNALGNDAAGNAAPVGNAEGNGVEESKLPAKKKLKFT